MLEEPDNLSNHSPTALGDFEVESDAASFTDTDVDPCSSAVSMPAATPLHELFIGSCAKAVAQGGPGVFQTKTHIQSDVEVVANVASVETGGDPESFEGLFQKIAAMRHISQRGEPTEYETQELTRLLAVFKPKFGHDKRCAHIRQLLGHVS